MPDRTRTEQSRARVLCRYRRLRYTGMVPSQAIHTLIVGLKAEDRLGMIQDPWDIYYAERYQRWIHNNIKSAQTKPRTFRGLTWT